MIGLAWDWVLSSGLWNHLSIVLMALITMITRSFFFIPEREIPWPAWASRGLQFAPIAAVSAVIVPEIIMTNGELITTFKDARLYGAFAGLAYFVIRRGKGQVVMGTMLAGMLVFLPLRLGLGW
jgi:branched-subunit amino acid transport protein